SPPSPYTTLFRSNEDSREWMPDNPISEQNIARAHRLNLDAAPRSVRIVVSDSVSVNRAAVRIEHQNSGHVIAENLIRFDRAVIRAQEQDSFADAILLRTGGGRRSEIADRQAAHENTIDIHQRDPIRLGMVSLDDDFIS